MNTGYNPLELYTYSMDDVVEFLRSRLPWNARARLLDVPNCVKATEAWPAWRRWLHAPENAVWDRIEALAAIRASGPEGWRDAERIPFQGSRLPGLCARSMVRWALLDRFDRPALTVHGWPDRRARLVSPGGPAVVSITLRGIVFDARKVEGITAGKGIERFEDLQSFGEAFLKEESVPVSLAGLERMLAHREIRILHAPASSDHALFSMWDGRLFVSNSGGSHHLAAAICIARHLDVALPITSAITLEWLNEPTWRWLIDTFVPMQDPFECERFVAQDLAKLLGTVYLIHLPRGVGEGVVYLLPRANRCSEVVAQELASVGMSDITHPLTTLLRAQTENERVAGAILPGNVVAAPWLDPH